mmetsp:Transcript_11981/g.17865  ORF Transcript_11981/g.17865 Transcript_11981/m.17865 type:complete len:284 (+) Transcript_11981:27-878(+)
MRAKRYFEEQMKSPKIHTSRSNFLLIQRKQPPQFRVRISLWEKLAMVSSNQCLLGEHFSKCINSQHLSVRFSSFGSVNSDLESEEGKKSRVRFKDDSNPISVRFISDLKENKSASSNGRRHRSEKKRSKSPRRRSESPRRSRSPGRRTRSKSPRKDKSLRKEKSSKSVNFADNVSRNVGGSVNFSTSNVRAVSRSMSKKSNSPQKRNGSISSRRPKTISLAAEQIIESVGTMSKAEKKSFAEKFDVAKKLKGEDQVYALQQLMHRHLGIRHIWLPLKKRWTFH